MDEKLKNLKKQINKRILLDPPKFGSWPNLFSEAHWEYIAAAAKEDLYTPPPEVSSCFKLTNDSNDIADDDVNHAEHEDDKTGYKSNGEESMNEANTIEEGPDQQHDDELDVVQDYNCDTCDQVFNSKKKLKKHRTKEDTPEGKHACEICERTVKESKILRITSVKIMKMKVMMKMKMMTVKIVKMKRARMKIKMVKLKMKIVKIKMKVSKIKM